MKHKDFPTHLHGDEKTNEAPFNYPPHMPSDPWLMTIRGDLPCKSLGTLVWYTHLMLT